jgi:hypothetical protein
MMLIWYQTNLEALNTMVPSELTGEVNMGVISISSVLEMGPLYRPRLTRGYL